MSSRLRLLFAITATALPSLAWASELSYTYLDFAAVDNSVDARGSQSPVPGQTVAIATSGGDGIGAGGSFAIGERFYVGGYFRGSIIDFTGTITSPLATVTAADDFDLISSSFGFGYIHEIGENLDFIAEASFDSSNLDFGTFVGENFDIDESGVGASLGFRWNPTMRFETRIAGHYTPVAEPLLTERRFEKGTVASVGLRWYFFQNLAIGLDHESGELETTTLFVRFTFGELPL